MSLWLLPCPYYLYYIFVLTGFLFSLTMSLVFIYPNRNFPCPFRWVFVFSYSRFLCLPRPNWPNHRFSILLSFKSLLTTPSVSYTSSNLKFFIHTLFVFSFSSKNEYLEFINTDLLNAIDFQGQFKLDSLCWLLCWPWLLS